MREAPSAYIFDSDGAVHRQRRFEGEEGEAQVVSKPDSIVRAAMS